MISLPALCRLLFGGTRSKRDFKGACKFIMRLELRQHSLFLFSSEFPFFGSRSLLALFARSLFKHIRLIPFHRVGLGSTRTIEYSIFLLFSLIVYHLFGRLWRACVPNVTRHLSTDSSRKNLVGFSKQIAALKSFSDEQN